MSTAYHPIRLNQVKKRRAERVNRAKVEMQRRILAGISGSDLEEISADRSHLAKYESDEGLTADLTSGWRQAIYERIGMAVDTFDETGANIFDMSRLAPLFANTDVDDIELNDTPMPFTAFYLHFGETPALRAPVDGMHIEGAYLRSIAEGGRDLIEITFVCNHPDHANAAKTPLGLTWSRMTTAIGTRLDRNGTVGESIAREGFAGDPALEGSARLVAAAVRMTVNGVLYLSTARADVELAYPPDAPQDLVREAADRKPWIAGRAADELEKRGYSKVKFVGRNVVPAPGKSGGAQTGETVEPHWRRGHWRRVVHGQGRLLREWRWFMPVIVNRHLGEPKRGRIYDVEPPVAPGQAAAAMNDEPEPEGPRP